MFRVDQYQDFETCASLDMFPIQKNTLIKLKYLRRKLQNQNQQLGNAIAMNIETIPETNQEAEEEINVLLHVTCHYEMILANAYENLGQFLQQQQEPNHQEEPPFEGNFQQPHDPQVLAQQQLELEHQNDEDDVPESEGILQQQLPLSPKKNNAPNHLPMQYFPPPHPVLQFANNNIEDTIPSVHTAVSHTSSSSEEDPSLNAQE